MCVAYSFRIRFKQSSADTLQTDLAELELCPDEFGSPLRLVNSLQDEPIRQAEELILTQAGYQTKELAEAGGEQLLGVLMLVLARHRLGADFGSRAPKSVWTEHGLDWLGQQIGTRILNSVHGMMIYQTEPKPKFVKMEAKALRGVDLVTFSRTFKEAASLNFSLTDRDFLALSLFNASFFQQSGDSRFLLLMIAIEAMLELPPRSASAQEHVKNMIAATRQANIAQTEKDSMIGALRWLNYESISRTGRQHVQKILGERVYLNMSATDFFTHCYTLRSNLVHGNMPYPTFEDISAAVGDLEVMVSDLITTPILGLPDAR